MSNSLRPTGICTPSIGGANEPVEDDSEVADEDVADALGVQRLAEPEEVFELRCA